MSGTPIEDDIVLRIQVAGLAGLLKFTTQDIEFACLQVDGEKLQNILVGDISEYLSKL